MEGKPLQSQGEMLLAFPIERQSPYYQTRVIDRIESSAKEEPTS